MKREFDIDIRMLSIQNEPELTYYYPTCKYEPALYARAVRTVQQRLDRMAARVSVLGPDVCRLYNLKPYLDEMLALGYAERGRGLWPKPLLVHHYDLSVGFHQVDKDPAAWRTAREIARETGQPLWLIETANYLSYEVRQGSWLEALIWARKIHHALVDGDCEVVCYWALFFDKVGESLIYCRKDGLDTYQISFKYYTSMNYYRFVRPGMVRKGAFSADGDLFATAFENEADGARTVVVVNWSHAPKRVTFGTRVDAAYERHETTKERFCRRVEFDPARLVLPPRSVTTFVKPGG
jgi:O-glycosyl hydrolase